VEGNFNLHLLGFGRGVLYAKSLGFRWSFLRGYLMYLKASIKFCS